MTIKTETEKQTRPAIDFNGVYPISAERTAKGDMIVELDLSASSSPNPNVNYFISHMCDLAWVQAGGDKIFPTEKREEALRTKKLHFTIPAEAAGGKIYVGVQQQRVASVEMKGSELATAPDHEWLRMTVSETRALSLGLRLDDHMRSNELAKLPYDRYERAGFDPQKHAPITDLHTHSSAQIKPEDLLEAAKEADLKGPEPVGYPVELLKLLGVPPVNQKTHRVQGFAFTPCKNDGLECEQGGTNEVVRISELTDIQRQAIINKMRVMPDRTMLFSDFDRHMYRYRNPLVKHPALAKAIIHKIAEDYAAQGIEYAELSTGSMLNPAWLKEMVEAIDEIEKNGVGPDHKKVKMRFLVGLPRNITPQETIITLEKIKYLARHPYIAGIDLLGYESGKTSDFHWALAHMAQWARDSEGTELKKQEGWDFQRDFTIRMHAGETGKNPENVRDAIGIAHEYDVRVRVAHALTAKLDKDASMWLDELVADRKKDQFMFEMCPDSNQMYLTKPLVHKSPVVERARKAPVVLGTDGGGAAMTDAKQLALSALAAGVSLDELARMREHELGFVKRQAEREAFKTQAFEKTYGPGEHGLDAFIEGYKDRIGKIPEKNKAELLNYLPESFYIKDETGSVTTNEKTPILIGGASGSSWKEIPEHEQHQIEAAMDLLVRSSDPSKVYFVLGRVQKEGVSRALDVAVKRYNREHPENKFAVLGRLAEAEYTPSGELAESITWLQNIPGGRDAVPASMVNFIKEHNGHALYFNGNDFTAEMILGSSNLHHDIPFGLVAPNAGRVADVAEIIPRESQCQHMPKGQNHVRDFMEHFVDRILVGVSPHSMFRSEEQREKVLLGEVRDKDDFDSIIDKVLEQRVTETHTSYGKSKRAGFTERV